ncbi:LOW QUALITY PROTEIN: Olfactory receptor 52K1, partial [Galemys pyrenaicus]
SSSSPGTMSGWDNGSSNVSYTSFLLMGFPGLNESRALLVLPSLNLCLMIISANVLVIHTVLVHRSLHQPMYLLVAVLLTVDICAATTVMPAMLFSFSTHFNRISLARCLVQMFCIYFLIVFDCNILLVMALDHFVAVCYPLRYPEIVTSQLLTGLLGVAAARSTCIVAPVVGLASRVRFCRSDVIHHFACEHMALMKLSCGDISLNKTVGLTLRIVNRVLDMLLLGVSYSRIIRAAFQMSSGGAHSKALNTCGSHLLVIFTVYTSSMSSSIVYRVARSASQDVHNLLSAFYLLLPCLVNPVIYGARTKEIRQHLATLFQRAQPQIPTSYLLYMTIIFANTLIICTVTAPGILHQSMYMLITLLLAINICTAIVVMPKMLEDFVPFTSPISWQGCLAQIFFTYFTLLLDYNLFQAIALAHYAAICHPLGYTDLMTSSHLLGIPAILALTWTQVCWTAVIRHFTCEYTALLNITCRDFTFNNPLNLAMWLITVPFDLTLLESSYTCIIYAAFQISSEGAQVKALNTCGSHLLVILNIYLSGLSTSIVFQTVSQNVKNLLSGIYLLLPGALNPLIYGVRTRKIWQHAEKILCGKEATQEAGEKTRRLQNLTVEGKSP